MGYYTRFYIRTEPYWDPERLRSHLKAYLPHLTWVNHISDDDPWELISSDTWKWYLHEQDLSELSSRDSLTLLILKGVGEEPNDIWVKYFKNRGVQKVKGVITFEDFDPVKLRAPEEM